MSDTACVAARCAGLLGEVSESASYLTGIRLEVIAALAEGPMCVSQIVEALELGITTVSRCLGVLRGAGLVDYSSRKNEHIYRLTERVRVNLTASVLALELKVRGGGFVRVEIDTTSD